ncbi:MAG: tRNA threonylcarbamoyladenosine dehydratase [Candidatus Syntrophosphaera sp.]
MSGAGFSRTRMLVGEAGMKALRETRVCVIGLGGVGSYACEALARSGIGHFTLIDFDTVGETNLNRQLIALRATLGRPKTQVMKERIQAINPEAEVVLHQEFLSEENRDELLGGSDYYVDAIDSLNPKVSLLQHAVERELKIIAIMGAGNRFDPARIHLAPLNRTHGCPLARRVRKYLARRGVKADFPCVYSNEPPLRPETDGELLEEIILDRGRPRQTIGSISYMPAIMGMTAASWVIRRVLDTV